MKVIQRSERVGDMAVVVPFFDCVQTNRRVMHAVAALVAYLGCADLWVSETIIPSSNPQLRLHNHVPFNAIVTESPALLWHKERSINIAWQHLITLGYTKLAWLDCDVQLIEGWYEKWSAALDHHKSVQPFTRAVRIYPDGTDHFHGGVPHESNDLNHTGYRIQGIAWGYQAAAIREAGWLYDEDLSGSGDDELYRTIHGKPLRVEWAAEWEKGFAGVFTPADLGCVVGDAVTPEFAPKVGRKYYHWRDVGAKYDYTKHLITNESGALEWADDTPQHVVNLWASRFKSYA